MKKTIYVFLLLLLFASFCSCNNHSDMETENTSAAVTTTEITETTPEMTSETERDYVLNTNSMKFHYPSCYAAEKISEKNRKEFHGTRTSAIAQGYDACGICNP